MHLPSLSTKSDEPGFTSAPQVCTISLLDGSKLTMQFMAGHQLRCGPDSRALAQELAGTINFRDCCEKELPSGLNMVVSIQCCEQKDTRMQKAAAVVKVNNDPETGSKSIFFTITLENARKESNLMSYFCTLAQSAFDTLPSSYFDFRDTIFSLPLDPDWHITLPPLFSIDEIGDKHGSVLCEPIWADKRDDATVLFVRFLDEEAADHYMSGKRRVNEKISDISLHSMPNMVFPITYWELQTQSASNFYWVVHTEGPHSKGGIMYDLSCRMPEKAAKIDLLGVTVDMVRETRPLSSPLA
jgi:hypothetical protein